MRVTLMTYLPLRGGLHFAALRSHRLEIPLAVPANPGGGAARLRRTAWEEVAIAQLQQRAGVAAPTRRPQRPVMRRPASKRRR